MDDDPLDLVGDVLGEHFRIEAFAGEGLLSVVYRGRHVDVDAQVAIKFLSLPTTLDSDFSRPIVENFQQGCRLHYELARGNLNIAQTLASGSTLAPRTGATLPYLVREWFEGESLARDLARRRPSPDDEAPAPKPTPRTLATALAMLDHVADGLAYAHDRKISHLSLRPSNIFLAVSEGKVRSKILDFGVGRAVDQAHADLPGIRAQILSPGYAAPEQLLRTVGDVGPATDVYTLALLLLEILTDRPVVDEPDVQKAVLQVLDRDARPSPRAHGLTLPDAVEKVFVRALSLDPTARYADARFLWTALREAEATVRGLRIRPALANPNKRRGNAIGERLRSWSQKTRSVREGRFEEPPTARVNIPSGFTPAQPGVAPKGPPHSGEGQPSAGERATEASGKAPSVALAPKLDTATATASAPDSDADLDLDWPDLPEATEAPALAAASPVASPTAESLSEPAPELASQPPAAAVDFATLAPPSLSSDSPPPVRSLQSMAPGGTRPVAPGFTSLFSVRRSSRPPPFRPRRSSRPPVGAPSELPPNAKLRDAPARRSGKDDADTSSFPTIPAPPLLPDSARREPSSSDTGPQNFASLDGLDVSPITSELPSVPQAPIVPSIASDEPTVPIAEQIKRRAKETVPTPLASDFTRELALEIRRQAELSALSDPALPTPRVRTDAVPPKRADAPQKRLLKPALLGAAACVLVGLGAVAFIRSVSKPPPSSGVTAIAPTAAWTSNPSLKALDPPPATAAPAASSASLPAAPSAAPSVATVSTPAAPTPRFQQRAAKAALDRVGKDLNACRFEKKGLWGTGGATVKFGNDGKVTEVTLGPPFRTAPEGACVLAKLKNADMGPFEGRSIAVAYDFFVPFAVPK